MKRCVTVLFILLATVTSAVVPYVPRVLADLAAMCSYGPAQCCSTVETSLSLSVQTAAGLLDVKLPDGNVRVGLECEPISQARKSGYGCPSGPVCCRNNILHGMMALDCGDMYVKDEGS